MKRNLLLCFDAFGTLFRPRRPIAEQYGSVARSMGVKIEDEEVAKSFKTAFKEVSKANPNYGKTVDMGAKQWWTDVINKTFQPHHPGPLPTELAPNLIHRFWSKEGYEIYPDVLTYLQKLAHQPSRLPGSSPRVVVGVITNSDDRVPDVLSSLGLRMNDLRHGSKLVGHNQNQETREAKDVDFSIMSHDVGFEKPHGRIFSAATNLLKEMLQAESGGNRSDPDLGDWELLYVGDEVGKDAGGAIDAGWKAAIVDRGGEVDPAHAGDRPGVEGFIEVKGKQVPVLRDFAALSRLETHYLLAVD